ncbi:HET-domain-containing protein [Lentinus brumalis]|uniref:HET-domain-containing protein n=1 Tax=Lentinus brumalis TaxID=2498619 RepID=A0A371CKT1_9APHY|nr:HET-domain-containing protein [Polyporus brumalis]
MLFLHRPCTTSTPDLICLLFSSVLICHLLSSLPLSTPRSRSLTRIHAIVSAVEYCLSPSRSTDSTHRRNIDRSRPRPRPLPFHIPRLSLVTNKSVRSSIVLSCLKSSKAFPMWVLSTNRAELHEFASPEDIPDEYAILSHTWNNRPQDGPLEQSFKEVRKIQKRCAQDGRNPRDFVTEKIRRCCELAQKHGYKWVWIDTCCIDKTSSAELSEAINSMFRYYALAAICYGYLQDVNTEFVSLKDLENDRHSRNPYRQERYRSFGSSIWFQRGWTLQELIAPRFFIFLSSSWEIIGTKADFAELLEWHFGISAAMLRLQVSHTEFSIAQRMSWFQGRRTTRPEDEAYCLLRLFDIHMPTLYGEGRNAFRRLQEEIMKQSADTTLFAWRWSFTDSPERCLLAASPADFKVSWRKDEVVYTPPRRTQVPADTTANPSH